jgi:ABC-type Mn2+/Zn2+ transport system permease subunit/Mn-dependent DtxR family transcriptional regulator
MFPWAAAVLLLAAAATAEGARIGDLVEWDPGGMAMRFLAMEDASLRRALAGSALLGVCCGMMGAFLVVRRMALLGDALSHAVLPGVALGFLWGMTKNPLAIFIGAVVAGLLGAAVVQWVRRSTPHREDAALGFVLSSFFGLGIVLITMIRNLPGGGRGGLEGYLFGQAAALGPGDVALLAGTTVLAVGVVAVFHKEYLATGFDEGFARSIGLPVRALHHGLMMLLAFTIVSSLQAVGVVLVSALLVIPAASARLLTDRFTATVVLSAAFGLLSGVAGSFFSFTGPNLPTGPFMVLTASFLFTATLFGAPRHGILPRLIRRHSRSARIRRENTLKAVHRAMEDDGFRSRDVSIKDMASLGNKPSGEVERELRSLRRSGLATVRGGRVSLTDEGWTRAREIVRNHRLWELYLTNAASLAPDHVHDDAEKIEHVLGEETVRQLERRLEHARRDPHGRPIPETSGGAAGFDGGRKQ